MKKLIIILLACISSLTYAVSPADNTSCANALALCMDTTVSFDNSMPGTILCNPNPLELWFMWKSPITGSKTVTLSSPNSISSVRIWGPFSTPSDVCNTLNTTNSVYSVTTSFTSQAITYTYQPGWYIVKVVPSVCNSSLTFNMPEVEPFTCASELPCATCIGSFAPAPDKDYIISTWVKEESAPPTKTSYTYPELYVEFPNLGSGATIGPITPSGDIIDGWQRIEQKFHIPATATSINFRLESTSGNVFFDDIRVFPNDGSVKTYVYDPVTLRLVAELDERNYATLYEYDEEGKLIRVKKETERGIMTIQENKSNITKH